MNSFKPALLFPGQGSQSVGMGREFYERYERAQEIFNVADEQLGFAFSKLCFEGPEEELQLSKNAQPAIFTVSVITLEILRDAGITPAAVAGHSLGEYAALYAAGCYDFSAGLRLVRRRGEWMSEDSEKNPGAMAAILGMDGDAVQKLCEDASGAGLVVAANFNTPEQTVISGSQAGVEAAIELARERGAKRAIQLKVQGAFHSPLMNGTGTKIAALLKETAFSNALIPVIPNVLGRIETDAGILKTSLIEQVTSPVLWTATIQELLRGGYQPFIEVGSGQVLSGMMRKIARDAVVYGTMNCETIEKTIESLR